MITSNKLISQRFLPHKVPATHSIQWNLRTRDTLGLIVLSLVESLSLSQRVPYWRFHCTQYITKKRMLHKRSEEQGEGRGGGTEGRGKGGRGAGGREGGGGGGGGGGEGVYTCVGLRKQMALRCFIDSLPLFVRSSKR